ncbi:MAG: hypothetical protein RML12_02975 [Xanthomonadales bacterium]|nr:hypothetical protein [Xanthomonadales bacterium]
MPPLPDAASLLVAVATALLLLLGFAGPPLLAPRADPAGADPQARARRPAARPAAARRRPPATGRAPAPTPRRRVGVAAAPPPRRRRPGRARRERGRGRLARAAPRPPRRARPAGRARRSACSPSTRQPSLALAQLAALALAFFGLLLLAAIGPALLRQWRAALPPDTPNWFLLNIQDEQAAAVRAALAEAGAAALSLEPFATGRLLAINGRPPRAGGFSGPARRRLGPRAAQPLLARGLPAGEPAARRPLLEHPGAARARPRSSAPGPRSSAPASATATAWRSRTASTSSP